MRALRKKHPKQRSDVFLSHPLPDALLLASLPPSFPPFLSLPSPTSCFNAAEAESRWAGSRCNSPSRRS